MNRNFSKQAAFTLVELLVVIAIIGILIGMLLPAVQQVREAARRTDCLNKLRQVGLATQMYHDSNNAFPPARLTHLADSSETGCFGCASWLVRILPFVEKNNIFQLWDFSIDYASQHVAAYSTPVETFLCSSRRSLSNAIAPDAVVSNTAGGGG